MHGFWYVGMGIINLDCAFFGQVIYSFVYNVRTFYRILQYIHTVRGILPQ